MVAILLCLPKMQVSAISASTDRLVDDILVIIWLLIKSHKHLQTHFIYFFLFIYLFIYVFIPSFSPSELCNKPMDIMFLLDGSSNIGASEFEEMKNFVQAFIESADISMYLF